MTTTPPLLEVQDLQVSYGSRTVVRGVDVAVAPGRTVALIGESGSGKSTIAKAVLRLLPAGRSQVSGRIAVQGSDVSGLSARQFQALRGRVLGFVPQDPASSLNPVRTVGSQALEAAALVPEARTAAARRALVLEAFERAGLQEPERIADSFPHQLSGGQLQRALIGIATIPRPALLVADEPTSALDVTVQKQILDLLDALREDLGLGILLITHDLSLAAERADELVVLRAGEVQEAGPAAQVLTRPATDYTRTLQADVPGLHPERFAPVRAQRDAAHPLAPGQDPAVRVEGISRTFRTPRGDVRALSDVSFSIPRGRTHALVGESGSGKSTAARALLGLESVDAGTLHAGTTEVGTTLTGRARTEHLRTLRRNLQLVHQNPFTSLDPRMSVRRIVREGLDRYLVGSKPEREETVRWALQAVGLPENTHDRRVTALSGGQRQRTAIARALVLRPEVLVLDEPTSALDVTVQAGILSVLSDLQRELGLTYLFISHDLAVVRQFADTVSVMRRGEVVESGRTADVLAAPEHDYTRRLIDSVPARAELVASAS